MPLDANKIKELMAKKATPVKRGGGGRRKVVDYTDRSYKAWFALEHTDPGEAFCDNDICNDPHGKYREVEGYTPEQVVAEVVTEEHGTVKMCRYCFTSNWLVKRDDGAQAQMAV